MRAKLSTRGSIESWNRLGKWRRRWGRKNEKMKQRKVVLKVEQHRADETLMRLLQQTKVALVSSHEAQDVLLLLLRQFETLKSSETILNHSQSFLSVLGPLKSSRPFSRAFLVHLYHFQSILRGFLVYSSIVSPSQEHSQSHSSILSPSRAFLVQLEPTQSCLKAF